MIEALIEQAVHAALCRTLEQSLQQAGLPPGVAQEMCSRLLTHPQMDKEQADAAAAVALDVADEEDFVANSPALAPPSEVQISAGTEEGTRAEIPTVEELVAWLVPALEDGATWADITRVAGQGHDCHKEALRGPDRV